MSLSMVNTILGIVIYPGSILSAVLVLPRCSVLKIVQLFYPGCGSQVQTGPENWHRKPMHGSILF